MSRERATTGGLSRSRRASTPPLTTDQDLTESPANRVHGTGDCFAGFMRDSRMNVGATSRMLRSAAGIAQGFDY